MHSITLTQGILLSIMAIIITFVGAILDEIFQKDIMSISDLAESVVDSSKSSVAKFKKITVNEVINNLEVVDGI